MGNSFAFLKTTDTLYISIIVTSRCNLRCSYCHYYPRVRMSLQSHDISDAVFERYLDFIAYLKAEVHSKIQVRFSGGEPLVLGARLYQLAKRVHDRLGEKTYILTNGSLIDRRAIGQAAENGISAFLISLENPFDIDTGAVSPFPIIDKIRRLSSFSVALLPAVVIVRNKEFSHLVDIADFFFARLGAIPTISELNFTVYESPAPSHLAVLKQSITQLVRKYYGKTPLPLFPYVTPELAYCFENKYILELGVAPDTYDFVSESPQESLNVAERYLQDAYPPSKCQNHRCDWFPYCHRFKWVWSNTFQDYCALKRTICEAYYDALCIAPNGGTAR